MIASLHERCSLCQLWQCQLGAAKHASLAATMKVEVNFTSRKVEVEVEAKARAVWPTPCGAHPT